MTEQEPQASTGVLESERSQEILKRFSNLQVTNTKTDIETRLRVKNLCHEEFLSVTRYILLNVPIGRNQSEALTLLETALMFANKGIMND